MALLIGLALLLTAWQHRADRRPGEGGKASPPERLAVALSWPLQRAFAAVGSGLQSFGSGLGQYRRLAEENRRLRAEKDELAAQKLRLVDADIENRHLRKLLGLALRTTPRPVIARVVAVNYGLSRKRLTIRAEDRRTLEVGNIVRAELGLVGRVSEVNGDRAYVFPLIDAEHAVAAVVQRPPRDQGMVHVAARPEYLPDMLVMDKLLGRADLREGDIVLTSGMGEVYPPGIPIGTIVRVRHSSVGSTDVTATIRPFVDFDHLSYVLVERHGG
ncbi:MAG: rod shape-determining protein MreC [Armatimonadetes bacterium]|nr:rod shape-determining protein MreC [Armatimonadota bacterium]